MNITPVVAIYDGNPWWPEPKSWLLESVTADTADDLLAYVETLDDSYLDHSWSEIVLIANVDGCTIEVAS